MECQQLNSWDMREKLYINVADQLQNNIFQYQNNRTMQSPNKSRKKYYYSIDAQTLCEDYASDQISTAKYRYYQLQQREPSQTKNHIRRDEYLNELSDIEISMKDHSREMVEYRNKIQKNEKLSMKYGKQSRLTKIMNIKVKASDYSKSRPQRIKEKFQQRDSRSSSKSLQAGQESISRNKVSRFDKIMNIKVNKPSVCSTLVNYQPKKVFIRLETSVEKQKRAESLIEDKENKTPLKNSGEIDKSERTWRHSQRKRQMELKQTKAAEQKAIKQARRKEIMFDNLLSKQMVKIQRERELTKRKNEGFSKYLYPYY